MNDDAPNSEAAETKIPYTGLRPFEPHEAELFFGRADQIEGLLARLESNRFLAVVGASGCGKSSLVRAGLLPALADGFLMGTGNDWRFVIARPGDAPFANLAQAIVTSVDGPHLLAPPTETQTPKNDTNPAELASVEKGLCTTSDLTKTAFDVVQKPENHRDELGGVGGNVSRSAADPYQLALVEYALRGSRTGLVDALAQCEIPATTSVLVLIDQFEELFRFRDLVRRDKGADTYETRNEAMSFVDLLLQTLQQTDRRVYVVITMRSDFMGDCDAFPGLPDAISNSQFLAPRMTRQQLSEAISDPLAACGYSVEPGFVNRVLNDVGSDPDQLPLMQHALLRTWQRTREQVSRRTRESSDRSLATSATELRIVDYEQVGGVSGALDQHANEIFEALGDETTRKRLQKVTVRLFCSLSERRDGGPLTRRPIKVALAALETGATESDVEAVVQAFQAANLLVFSPPGQPLGPTTRLDISHESLLRQWRRLEAWFDTETKSAMSYRRLMDAVRNDELTLSDTHLAQAQEWLKLTHPNVHWAMRYDGAQAPEASLFDTCRALVESSAKARRDRIDKERTDMQRERDQALRLERAEIDLRRAEDAEAALIRIRRRTKIAFVAGVFALFATFMAWANFRYAVAQQKLAEAVQIDVEAKADTIAQLEQSLGVRPGVLYHLGVGIDKYKSPAMRLVGAVQDAQKLQVAFSSNALKTRKVVSTILADEEATHARIIFELNRLAGEAKTNDLIVFTYSGFENQTTQEIEVNEKGGTNSKAKTRSLQLVPFDGDPEKSLLLSAADLYSPFTERGVPVAMFIDTCYAELIANELGTGYSSMAILASSTQSEISSETVDGGLFSRSCVAALNGAADTNNDGFVTMPELAEYVINSTAKQSKGRQHPVYRGGTSNLVMTAPGARDSKAGGSVANEGGIGRSIQP